MKGILDKRAYGALFGAALVLAVAGAAWACTAQPRIFSLGPQVGPVGLEIKMEGQTAGQVPVQVRWNSPSGTVIGQGVTDFNGNFSVPATIPEASPGMYFLVVTAGDAGVVRTPFEVTSENGPAADSQRIRTAVSTDLWSGFSRASGAQASEGIAASPAGDTVRAAIGGAMFALGATALAGISLVAVRRRRYSES